MRCQRRVLGGEMHERFDGVALRMLLREHPQMVDLGAGKHPERRIACGEGARGLAPPPRDLGTQEEGARGSAALAPRGKRLGAALRTIEISPREGLLPVRKRARLDARADAPTN